MPSYKYDKCHNMGIMFVLSPVSKMSLIPWHVSEYVFIFQSGIGPDIDSDIDFDIDIENGIEIEMK